VSTKNGVWHDAVTDPPENDVLVLAVKQLKNGTRDICLARCQRDFEYFDYVTGVKAKKDWWICGGNNNILYWMPLPKMPEVE